ncbi:MAG: penicillin-binding protein [Oscillospiraceae bacterium]|nr:penicillin-binding protein [Oscillospiraceae bacterium]
MRKIEKRAAVCLLLALALLLGLGVFTFRFVKDGGDWVSFPANRHLYNSKGQLSVGRILDRDGDLLSWPDEDGNRCYYANAIVRKATLHAVGDRAGNIGTGALSAFGGKLSGYNLLTGVYSPLGQGGDLYLTLDARLNYIAWQALGGKKGAVGVYNYKTGEVLCMLSAPSFDPLDPPSDVETNPAYEGVYMNRFLSGTFTPGSVFKTVTLTAALEQLPGVSERAFTCTGSVNVAGDVVTCPQAHGEMTLGLALARSCNGVFSQLASEVGAETMERYAEKVLASYSVNGIRTAAGSVDFSGIQIGWSAVGQGKDRVNPCALMVYMGAIANGGRAAIPQVILRTESGQGFPTSFYFPRKTGKLMESGTAETVAEMMALAVQETYGTARFPNMEICAKSGTAQVGGDKAPTAWFAGFLQNKDAPYAFVVMVEEGGSGAAAAGDVAAQVLDALVNGYVK